jgi:hypothetical protein
MTAPGAYPGAYPEASQATSALIWSIVGLVCCGPAAIVGYVQSKSELSAIAAGQRDPMNQGTANAARIIAIIVGVLWILSILAGIALIATGAGLGFLGELTDIDTGGF